MTKDKYEISLWEDYTTDTVLHNVAVYYTAPLGKLNLFDPYTGEKIKTLSANTSIYFKADQIQKLLIDNPDPPSSYDDDNRLSSYFYIEYRNSQGIPYDTYRIGYYYWGLAIENSQRHFKIWAQRSPHNLLFDINMDNSNVAKTLDSLWIGEHYEERKIAVVGSDTMTTYCRAVNPQLVENVNGTNTLTFSMYYTYIDENGIKQRNPFIDKLLINERKVKAFWKDRWYDFIIKSCVEDSGGKSVTYTCQDLFINELSKTGYNIELDPELNNNQGQAHELATYVLDQTDWKVVGPDSYVYHYDPITEEVVATEEQVLGLESDVITQEIEEQTYTVTVGTGGFDAYNQTERATTTTHIEAGEQVYVFFNQIQDLISNLDQYEKHVTSGDNPRHYVTGKATFQFLYKLDTTPTTGGTDNLINNLDCWTTKQNRTWRYYYGEEDEENYYEFTVGSAFDIFLHDSQAMEYRGKRLVKTSKTQYDPLTNKYCEVFSANEDAEGITSGDIIYKYTETEWQTPSTVNNIIINGSNFTDTSGWVYKNLSLGSCPPFHGENDWNGCSVMQVAPDEQSLSDRYIYNTALSESNNYLPNGMAKGEKYIFRYKVHGKITTADIQQHPELYQDGDEGLAKQDYALGNYITPRIYPYEINASGYPQPKSPYTNYIKTTYIAQEDRTQDDQNGYWNVCEITCIKSFSNTNIIDLPLGLFLRTANDWDLWIEEIQFFPLVYGENDNGDRVRINPMEMNANSIAKTYYSYYNHTTSKSLLDKDNITYLYHGDTDWPDADEVDMPYPDLTLQWNDNFEKIRSISVKQSNRFNIIQSIAETFQCWARFTINHESNGRIIYNEDGTPQKYLSFKKEIGQETGVGFIYGIDLNTIKRTIQSNQIVTKTIVNPNANEFATNGFCTIARSGLNYPRTSFILNFDYYVSHGMLSQAELDNDLYDSTNPLSYYYQLNELNTKYDNLSDKLVNLYKDRDESKANYTVLSENLTATIEERSNLRTELKERAGFSGNASWTTAIWNVIKKRAAEDATINAKMQTYIALAGKIDKLEADKANAKNHLDEVETTITQLEEGKNGQDVLARQIREVDLQFYNKYSRFIQEGSWQSEEYIDDDLYYLDAQSVAYTSSRPQVQYDISVLRLSSLDEYKYKIFRLGDISYIQDTEFFGYLEDGKTPYQEKVLVSEITSFFDEPEKDTLKIQNYKTQFEDLFQRITATTQSLQYASGEYAKVATIIQPDGTIKGDILQNSIALNEQLVYSSTNNLVVQDATGITVTDNTNPNRKTKVNAGGVFITNDGGLHWKNAINANGVATEQLTAGRVNVNDIMVYDGNTPTFRWDSQGINAFYYTTDNSGITTSVDNNKFVRFDRFGIYGMDTTGHSDEYQEPQSAAAIKSDEYSKFGMTWDGFFMKSAKGNGYVEISNENAIKVIDSGTERIKIGAFGTGTSEDPYYYGIQISNGDGNPVLVTEDDGSLWLKDSLTVETSEGTSVQIGKLGDGQVINANDTFIVNEDGSIIATNATISGQISALSGVIGGWQIEDNRLASYRQLANGELELVAELNGSVGSLSLGDNLTLSGDTSTIDAGGIIINGNESIITGQGDNSNVQYFSITPNKATFRNVDVSGKISTSVFETNKIQVVGGAMIFKPSFLIEDVQINSFTCEEATIADFTDNYICFIELGGTSYSIVHRITSITENNGRYTVSFTPSLTEEGTIRSVLILGPVLREDGTNDELDTSIFTIAVNSNDTTSMFMRRRGLTMEEALIQKDGNNYQDLYNTEQVKVFIGALESLDVTYMPSMQGYGFYSNNAYLEGSLVASQEVDNELIYTGINTLNDTVLSIPLSEQGIDDSPIILWGGAVVADVTDEQTGVTQRKLDIGNAPFQVTLNGSLYANNGLFEGSLITRSTIEASELRTAIIRGNGAEPQYPALRIYDGRNNGIGFFVDEDDDPQTADKAILYISGDGLHSSYMYDSNTGYYSPTENPFIGLDESGVNFLGNVYRTVEKDNVMLILEGGIISGETIGQSFNGKSNIMLDSTSINMSLTDINNVTSPILSINKNQITANTTAWLKSKLKLGNNVSFETVASGGFDIYVTAAAQS